MFCRKFVPTTNDKNNDCTYVLQYDACEKPSMFGNSQCLDPVPYDLAHNAVVCVVNQFVFLI